MKEIDLESLKKELNEIQFYKCNGIAIGDVLYYVILNDTCKTIDVCSGIKDILRMIIRVVCTVSYDFEKKGRPLTIFLFSNSYRGRRDHLVAFNNVANIADNYVKVICSKYKWSLWGIKYFYYPFLWNKELKKIIPNFGLRMLLLRNIFRAFMDYQYIDRYCKKSGWNINNLVTYCDVMPVDSFFVQRFNYIGKTTVTLQHGTYSASNNIWTFLGSKSTYFLAESEYSLECSQKVGYRGNMIVTGSPHHVGIIEKDCPPYFKKTNCIGVIMNSSMCPKEDNVKMIQVVQEFCEKTGRKLLLKYHPSNSEKDYKKYINTDITIVYGTNISIVEFSKMIDVAVISASTVFVTMLKEWKPVLLFVRENYDPKLFTNVEKFKFHNEKELGDLLDWVCSSNYMVELKKCRAYFSPQNEIFKNYVKAFHKIGI